MVDADGGQSILHWWNMKDPFVDYDFLEQEYDLTALLDNLPDTCKGLQFWADLKRLCPDALLNTLMVGARARGGIPPVV